MKRSKDNGFLKIAVFSLAMIAPCLVSAFAVTYLIGAIGPMHPAGVMAVGAALYESIGCLWRVAVFLFSPHDFLVRQLNRAANCSIFLQHDHRQFTEAASMAFFTEQRRALRKLARRTGAKRP